MNQYRYSLDTTSNKFICPDCRQKRFVRYVNNQTKKYVNERVGRCDRENSCAYHLTPKQFFANNDEKDSYQKAGQNSTEMIKQQIQFVSIKYLEKTVESLENSDFYKWLDQIPEIDAYNVACEYFLGSKKISNKPAVLFWQIDYNQQIRTGKIMHYNPSTGKRMKEITPTWVHTGIQDFTFHQYQLCFFGEHLLKSFPTQKVGIVESEKTAIVARAFMPEIIWLATGGQSGCKWSEYEVYKVLKDREVIWFPDYGFANPKTQKTCYQSWSDKVTFISQRMKGIFNVSKLLEEELIDFKRLDDDLADLLLTPFNYLPPD